jgi:tetratricopeptide (TPR) repeat protein
MKRILFLALGSLLLGSCASAPDLEFQRGRSAQGTGELREAIVAYRKAIARDARDQDAWFNLGVALQDTKQNKEAAVAYEKVLEIDPLAADAWINRGRLYQLEGKSEEARRCFERASGATPLEALPWVWLADLQRSEGHLDQAESSLAEAEKREPGTAIAALGRALLAEARGRSQEAADEAAKALQAAPLSRHAAEELLRLACAAKDHERIVIAAERILETPGVLDSLVLHDVATAYAALGRLDDAIWAALQAGQQGEPYPGLPGLLERALERHEERLRSR